MNSRRTTYRLTFRILLANSTAAHNTYIHSYIIIIHHLDIDPCSEGLHGCSQTCTNTLGSFTCGCNNGYLLDTDGAICIGMYKRLVLF